MSIEILKAIRKTERDCEEKIKKAESAKNNATLDTEKDCVLKTRDAEFQAKEEADKILSQVKNRIEEEFTILRKGFEEEKAKLKDKAKKIEKKAVETIVSKVM